MLVQHVGCVHALRACTCTSTPPRWVGLLASATRGRCARLCMRIHSSMWVGFFAVYPLMHTLSSKVGLPIGSTAPYSHLQPWAAAATHCGCVPVPVPAAAAAHRSCPPLLCCHTWVHMAAVLSTVAAHLKDRALSCACCRGCTCTHPCWLSQLHMHPPMLCQSWASSQRSTCWRQLHASRHRSNNGQPAS